MRVMILVGSGDTQSHSLSLGKEVQTKLNGLGAETELINLIADPLPPYDRAIERADAYDDKTRDFLKRSYEADAFVWVTPVYHNSYSSILKNALDWQHTKFPGKVVGLASNGGNRSPQAVDQLMIIARAQHLISGRVRVCTDASDYDGLKLADDGIRARITDFCDELVYLVGKIA
jgi:azobenzene reductase